MNQELIPVGVDFIHPLIEVNEIEGHICYNVWGFCSVIVNAILNPETTSSYVKCEEMFKHLIIAGNPVLNIEYLIEQIKERRLDACLMACNTMQNALEAKMDIAFKEEHI